MFSCEYRDVIHEENSIRKQFPQRKWFGFCASQSVIYTTLSSNVLESVHRRIVPDSCCNIVTGEMFGEATEVFIFCLFGLLLERSGDEAFSVRLLHLWDLRRSKLHLRQNRMFGKASELAQEPQLFVWTILAFVIVVKVLVISCV